MDLSENEIREYYKKLSQNEIISLAKNPAGLRKEIVPIFIEELKTRGLQTDFENWVKIETDSFEGTERDLIFAQIEQNSCCNCGSFEKLYGFNFEKIYSFVLFSKFEFAEKILCKSCGNKERFKIMGKTALVGWWSKKGIIYTPYFLVNGLIRYFRIESESNKVINNFIDRNTGKLRLVNQKKIGLQTVICENNEKVSNSVFGGA